MADYFTNFSFIVEIKEPAQSEYVLDLANIASIHRYEAEQLPATFPQPLRDVLEDWHFEVEQCDEGIWFHSTEGGVGAVSALVQHLLQKFQISGPIGFEWSHDCSQPKVDAFGGGAAVVTATEIKSMTTSNWLAEQMKALAKT